MKIVFTGGGTGGHFYPIIAVAEKCVDIVDKEKIVDAKFYYLAPSPYNKKLLYDNHMQFIGTPAGKLRRYASIFAPIDVLKTFIGTIKSIFTLWRIYPDVVFAKGAYGSFPTLFAAKLLKIPVVIHESDSVPGRTNLWAGKFAKRIAVSYPEASEFFDKEKVAHTGQPVRKEILQTLKHGAFEYLHLEENIPVVLILGGSQGAKIINETILDALPTLLNDYQVIHQVGDENLREVENTSKVILERHPYKNRYKIFPYLNNLGLKMSAGVATLIISRAGSTIFEIAGWGIPSIIIPITDTNGDHQRKNAFNYARSGACVVIEEQNLASHILVSEISRIISGANIQEKMRAGAKKFFKGNAAETIAKELVSIAVSHEDA